MKLRERFSENPFRVLGAPADAPRPELERAAQRLLAELTIGRQSALHYETSVGNATRTPELVRSAAASVREPLERLVHEEWARVPSQQPDALHPAEAPFEGATALVLGVRHAPRA
jgi:hypothetical protein